MKVNFSEAKFIFHMTSIKRMQFNKFIQFLSNIKLYHSTNWNNTTGFNEIQIVKRYFS